MKKEELARLDGMDYALRQIEKVGTEQFRKELKSRVGRGLSLTVTQEEIDNASQKIKTSCLETVLAMSIMVLHDEFDFGEKRIKRFMERYLKKTDCLMGGFASWDDYQQIIKDELGIDIKIDLNE